MDAKIVELNGSLRDLNRELDVTLRRYRELTSSMIAAGKAYYLVCEAGYPNYGDELIAREWLKYLSFRHPDVPVYLDCARPGPAAAILRNVHPHMQVTDTISRLTTENMYADVDDGSDRVARIGDFVHAALEDDGVAARYAAGIDMLRAGVRSVHFLGGGYMNSSWQKNLARLELGRWCGEHGIPAMATGAGLMPLNREDLIFVGTMLGSFRSFTVRDEDTYRALADDNNSVSLRPDDCFVNALHGCYAKERELPETMVCIQSDLVTDVAALNRHVLVTLRNWGLGPQTTIGVAECSPYVDYPIVATLKSAGYHVAFFPLAFLLREGFPARPGQRWLTTRYHPHLLAAAKGCSGSFISVNEDYYEVKHRAALRMGSRWTNSVIGAPAVVPGPGFADVQAPEHYSQQIHQAANCMYGN
mgnify:FL=1